MSDILAIYREPFGVEPHVQHLAAGATLADMRATMRGLPADFDARGVICVNGRPVPRQSWPLVRPKPSVTEVTFHVPVAGGGGGKKNIFALIASIALVALTGLAAGGWFQTAGGWFAKGTISANLLAAGISLVGTALISAMVAPPALPERERDRRRDLGAASVSGNALDPNGPIPRVVGTMKVFPPLAMEPFTYFEGPDEIVEAAYVLAGPHALASIRVGAAPAASMADIEVETREGWPGDPRVELLRRQSRTEMLQSELRGHLVSDSDNRTLDSVTGDILTSLPQPQVVATRQAPDEHQIQITFPQGLWQTKDDGSYVALRVPIRMRMREVGSATWITLPEVHFRAARLGQMRATIRLLWGDGSMSPSAPAGEGFCEARRVAPGQVTAPATADWIADSYFDAGSGDDWLANGNVGSTRLAHVSLDRYNMLIGLDEGTFPRGQYEFEITRGAAFRDDLYQASSYQYDGALWDFFSSQGTSPGQIVMARDRVIDTLYILRSVSVWNEHPLPSRDLATIAIRARNRTVDRLSVVASGYTRDWDGNGWNTWATTDNPAPHLRDVWAGLQNADPLPEDVIDDAGLVQWRGECIAKGYRVNAIMEGVTVDEAARIIASCGYAKPTMSETWGVARDYDRSAEAPVQVFTPRNSSGFQWTRAFPRVADGLRITYADETSDYDPQQEIVWRPGVSNDDGLLEQVTYQGITTLADVQARAQYDLAQPHVRGTFYTLDTAADAIVCRRGDLVGVQHDMLRTQAGTARVVGWSEDATGVIAIDLDADVPVVSAPDMLAVADMLAVPDMLALGIETGVAIRRSGGAVTVHAVANAAGLTDRLVFSPAIAGADMTDGALVTVGPLGQEFDRFIVFGVAPRPDFQASLTLIDEAPQLWSA